MYSDIYFIKISIIPYTALATQYKERLTSVTRKANKRTKLSYDRLTWLLLLILETNNTISNHYLQLCPSAKPHILT